MLKLEKFTIEDFAATIKQQTSSWTNKLPFVRSSDGVKEGQRVVKLVDAFTDEQKRKPTAINKEERYQPYICLMDQLFIALLLVLLMHVLSRMKLAQMMDMTLASVDEIISNYENMETIYR